MIGDVKNLQISPEESALIEKKRREDEKWAAIRLKAEKNNGKWGGQCVRWVKHLLGYPDELNGIALAKKLVPNVILPERGTIVITKESRPGTNTGHWELILEVDWDQKRLLITDSNYTEWEKVDVRWIDMDNLAIIGFYKLIIDEGGE